MPTVKSGKEQSLINRVFSHWTFWVSVGGFIFLFLRWIFYYNSAVFFGIAMMGSYFIIGLFLVFLGSLIGLFIWVIRELLKIRNKSAIDWLPFALLGFQIGVILFPVICPIPDYYQQHQKDLNKLVLFVEKQLANGAINKGHDSIKVPGELSGIADRYANIELKKDMYKIRVHLTGGAMGGHSFLMYRSDGSPPTREDLYTAPECHPRFERKSDKWFWVDVGD